MSKKDKARRDSVFSWNDQSTNIRTVTWESGKKLNIKMYQKKWKTVKSVMAIQSRLKNTMAFKDHTKSSRYVRHLRYSLDMETPKTKEEDDQIEEKRKITRKVKLQNGINNCK